MRFGGALCPGAGPYPEGPGEVPIRVLLAREEGEGAQGRKGSVRRGGGEGEEVGKEGKRKGMERGRKTRDSEK